VKRTKGKFDRLKLDTMQKIDLLAASRSNMFSQVLVKYQSSMLNFWEKMSYRMTAVADSFKGYQYYEFNMLKVFFPVHLHYKCFTTAVCVCFVNRLLSLCC